MDTLQHSIVVYDFVYDFVFVFVRDSFPLDHQINFISFWAYTICAYYVHLPYLLIIKAN